MFSETKARLQKRSGITEKEFAKTKITYIPMNPNAVVELEDGKFYLVICY